MHLTRHTDYALRLLISLAGRADGRAQIAEIAEEQAISRTHLMKVANRLARAGVIEAQRGRGGGIRLARDPADIAIAAVIDEMEPRCALVDCSTCRLTRKCALPGALDQAAAAFRAVLARFTLADVIREPASWTRSETGKAMA